MRLFLLILCLFATCHSAFARGGEGVGGGDPMAAEFVKLAKKFTRYAERNFHIIPSPHEIRAMKHLEKQWRYSINYARRKSLVVFVEERPKDDFGIPKAAVYNMDTLEVRVHRSTWRDYTDQQKLELVVMELLGMVEFNDARYEQAMELVSRHGDRILN